MLDFVDFSSKKRVGRCAEWAFVNCKGSNLHSQHVLMAHPRH